ncbi:hypothetical protein KAI56_02570 [Candidatus Parcubacteria bacterium]|nr:hypothetical protein [Candidatus Parcubacteria bacterium]
MEQQEIDNNKNRNNLLADIEITRANLYVFKNAEEKDVWSDLLDKAEENVQSNPEYSRKIVNRVDEVIKNLWKRIFTWKEFQKKIIKYFIWIILAELIVISIYYYFVDIIQYGFYSALLFGLLGGTLGVILNLGKDLQIEESNQLGTLKLILRPLIGCVSALILFSFMQLNIISIAESLDQKFVLIILSIFAGYSERFVSKALDDYAPKIFNK